MRLLPSEKTVGKRIREARTKAGLTQEELGKLVGVSKPLVSLWESGDRQPKDEQKVLIVRTLGGDIYDIFFAP